MRSEGLSLDVENAIVDITTPGVGLTCFNYVNLLSSNVTIDAGYFGVNANNETLTAKNTVFNIQAEQGNGLYTYIGGSILLEECTGSVQAGTAAIYKNNAVNDPEPIVQLKNCDGLSLLAPYGIMSFGDVEVDGGEISFSDDATGIYAYTPDAGVYTANTDIKGDAVVDASNCARAVRTFGTFTCAQTATFAGQVLSQTDTELVLYGTYALSADLVIEEGRGLEIAAGAVITVPEGILLDATQASALDVNGTLEIEGTLRADGGTAVNRGTIANRGTVALTEGTAMQNEGTITSLCTAAFAVEGNAIELEHAWDAGVVTTPPTLSAPGEKTFTCQNDPTHTYTEPVPQLEEADYTAVDAAIEKAQALDRDEYVDLSAVDAAVAAVERGKDSTQQAAVDAMAKAIEDAIAALQKKPAEEPGTPEVPETGYALPIALWAVALLAAGGCFAAVWMRKRAAR